MDVGHHHLVWTVGDFVDVAHRQQDGRRDGEHRREWRTGRFAELIDARGVPWLRLTGAPARASPARSRPSRTSLDTHFTYAYPLT